MGSTGEERRPGLGDAALVLLLQPCSSLQHRAGSLAHE